MKLLEDMHLVRLNLEELILMAQGDMPEEGLHLSLSVITAVSSRFRERGLTSKALVLDEFKEDITKGFKQGNYNYCIKEISSFDSAVTKWIHSLA